MKCQNFKTSKNPFKLKTENKLCNHHTARCGVDLIRTYQDAGLI